MAWLILTIPVVAWLEWIAICRKNTLIMLASDLIAFLPLICFAMEKWN